MTINANTKIAAVLAKFQHALEVIISINTKLASLRTPFVRRLLSGTKLDNAAKITGCNSNEAYEKVVYPGFATPLKISAVKSAAELSNRLISVENNEHARTASGESISTQGWDQVMSKYKTRIQVIDLRSLDMPLSMLTISGELRYMPAQTALIFSLRKHVPVSFLHQLEEKGFDYRIKTISEGEVNLLILTPDK